MAYHEARYLRQDRETLTTSFESDEFQKEQARRLKQKIATSYWFCGIRVLVAIPPQDRDRDRETDEDDENETGDIRTATLASQLKKVTGGFNLYSNDAPAQSLIFHPVTPIREKRLYRFAATVTGRRWAGWHNKFRVTAPELGVLMAIPSRDQPNLPRSVG